MVMRKTLAAVVIAMTLTGCASAAPSADDLDDNYSVVKATEGFGVTAAFNEAKKTPFVDVITRSSADIIFYAASNCPPVINEVVYNADDIDAVSGNRIVRLYVEQHKDACLKDVQPYVQSLTFKDNFEGVDLMNTSFKYCVKVSDVCFDFDRVFYQSGNQLEGK